MAEIPIVEYGNMIMKEIPVRLTFIFGDFVGSSEYRGGYRPFIKRVTGLRYEA